VCRQTAVRNSLCFCRFRSFGVGIRLLELRLTLCEDVRPIAGEKTDSTKCSVTSLVPLVFVRKMKMTQETCMTVLQAHKPAVLDGTELVSVSMTPRMCQRGSYQLLCFFRARFAFAYHNIQSVTAPYE
jgi:hypothetical protein